MADTQAERDFELRKAYVRGYTDALNDATRLQESLKHNIREELAESPLQTGTLPLDASLQQLDLEPSIFYILFRAGLRTVGDLIKVREDELLHGYRNIGRERAHKIKQALAKAGYQLAQ